MSLIKPEYQEIDFWGFDDDIPQSSPNTSEKKKEKKNSGNFFNQDKKETPDKKEKE